jgi:hypothetical protein
MSSTMESRQPLYQTRLFARQLNRLPLAGRQGVLALEQAREIMTRLVKSAAPAGDLRHKQTKHGELRLANCRKYDLGGGYRLVTVQDDDCLVLACIGSHDDCHRWLEKQREAAIDLAAVKAAGRLVEIADELESPPPAADAAPVPAREDPYEEALMERINQEVLRQVFRGLCGEKTCN